MNYSCTQMNVEITKDTQFSLNSTDNIFYYDNIYNDQSCYPTKIGIFLNDESGNTLKSAIILNHGFSSGLPGSWVIYDTTLAILVGNSVYLLSLPELNKLSVSEADFSTTFEIVKVGTKLVVHGESDISCFDLEGNKLWSFSGRDIFATSDNKKPFEIIDNCIKLIDFNDDQYFLNLDGKLIHSL